MKRREVHIVIAGLGNTGSHLAPLVARLAPVTRLTLVDPDAYGAANRAGQAIAAADAGPKAEVQAARLRRIRPELEVTATVGRIEDVPLGRLRARLIVSCVDSRLARWRINQIAWRLGVPWLDCGVRAAEWLARAAAFAPAAGAACLECAWGPQDYRLMEQPYSCTAGEAAPTNAPAALGALAAALVAVEVARLAAGEAGALAGRQIVYDGGRQRLAGASFRRNPRCAFDHAIWQVTPWPAPPEQTTVAEAIKRLGRLRVTGHTFARGVLACPRGCQRREQGLRLLRPLERCPACGVALAPAGFAHEWLAAELAKDDGARTLAEIGLATGDIVTDGDGRHWEIGGSHA